MAIGNTKFNNDPFWYTLRTRYAAPVKTEGTQGTGAVGAPSVEYAEQPSRVNYNSPTYDPGSVYAGVYQPPQAGYKGGFVGANFDTNKLFG